MVDPFKILPSGSPGIDYGSTNGALFPWASRASSSASRTSYRRDPSRWRMPRSTSWARVRDRVAWASPRASAKALADWGRVRRVAGVRTRGWSAMPPSAGRGGEITVRWCQRLCAGAGPEGQAGSWRSGVGRVARTTSWRMTWRILTAPCGLQLGGIAAFIEEWGEPQHLTGPELEHRGGPPVGKLAKGPQPARVDDYQTISLIPFVPQNGAFGVAPGLQPGGQQFHDFQGRGGKRWRGVRLGDSPGRGPSFTACYR